MHEVESYFLERLSNQSVFKIIKMDIKLILDQTKLVRVPLWIGHWGSLEIRISLPFIKLITGLKMYESNGFPQIDYQVQ